MHFKHTLIALSVAVGCGAASAQSGSNAQTSGAGSGTLTAAQQQSMLKLREAADRLRESIEAMRGRTDAAGRQQAIAQTQDALHATQLAMRDLPAEIRNAPAAAITPHEYDAAVDNMLRAADALRKSVQAMAGLPAGEERNQAMRQANEALLQTQVAAAAAYKPDGTNAMGASGSAGSASGASAGTAGMGASGSSSAGTGTNPGASASGSSSQKASARAAGNANTQGSVPAGSVLVLLPSAQGNDQKLGNGCWVRFFDGKQFTGDALTLVGPVSLPKTDLGEVWRDWESAVVGPKATVTTYDNENFNDRTAVLRKGGSFPDLRDSKLGWFEEVKSARVSCVS